MAHRRKEEEQGVDIWPATPKHRMDERIQGDIDFCSSLDCPGSNGDMEQLEW